MSLTFRPITRDDFDLVSSWLAEPHVEKWWMEDASPDAVEGTFGPSVDGDDPTEVAVVERDGQPIGMIQRYRNDDNPEWATALAPTGSPGHAAGIDYLIGEPTLIGQGIGTEMIQRFVEETWRRYPEVPAIVVTVNAENTASWRALEKTGFHRIWTGEIVSDDPSDAGISHCYVLRRAQPA